MTVRVSGEGRIELSGSCPIEDAAALQQHLLDAMDATVDWRSCTGAHTAVIQVLLAARPAMQGPPASEALRTWVEPLLAS